MTRHLFLPLHIHFMLVFLPLLPTRELSDTSFCISQESCFGFFLVTLPSSGCPWVRSSWQMTFTITQISLLPSSQGRFVCFLPICIFPSFTGLCRSLGLRKNILQPETWFSGELLMSTTIIITMFTHLFWSSCPSHTDLFLIYMLCFSGWLIFSFTWNMILMVRAVFVTVWNNLHFPSYSCFPLQLGERVLDL